MREQTLYAVVSRDGHLTESFTGGRAHVYLARTDAGKLVSTVSGLYVVELRVTWDPAAAGERSRS